MMEEWGSGYKIYHNIVPDPFFLPSGFQLDIFTSWIRINNFIKDLLYIRNQVSIWKIRLRNMVIPDKSMFIFIDPDQNCYLDSHPNHFYLLNPDPHFSRIQIRIWKKSDPKHWVHLDANDDRWRGGGAPDERWWGSGTSIYHNIREWTHVRILVKYRHINLS